MLTHRILKGSNFSIPVAAVQPYRLRDHLRRGKACGIKQIQLVVPAKPLSFPTHLYIGANITEHRSIWCYPHCLLKTVKSYTCSFPVGSFRHWRHPTKIQTKGRSGLQPPSSC